MILIVIHVREKKSAVVIRTKFSIIGWVLF